MTDSNAFYLTLQQTFAAVIEQVKLATDQDIDITIYAWGRKDPEIHLNNGRYGNDKVEVQGKSIGDLVNEFCRRVGFADTQKHLRIGAPMIDQPASKAYPGDPDNIPF